MTHAGWWTQAITEDDNHTIDRPFLFVFFAVFIILPIVLAALIGLSVIDVVVNNSEYNPASLGGGVAATLGGVAAFVVSMVALLYQDKKASPPSVTTTTTVATKTVEAGAASPVVGTSADGVHALSPAITPQDVGKSVAIVPPTRKPRARKKK